MATKKKTPSKSSRLQVRMYRQGLGDCFLITVPRTGARPFRMLIDCGVVLGTPDPVPTMTRVVEDIVAATGGEIDVLVVTHEHWDHVSGFVQASNLFFHELRVHNVWLAWTEDPKDKLAAKLRSERRTAEKALRMAVQHLAMFGASEAAARVDSLVGFFGARTGTTEAALDNVKKVGHGNTRYCQPGEPPIALADVPGVRFWVLGPPRDERLIKKANPNKGDAYGLDASPGGRQAYMLAALGAGEPIEDPFDEHHSIPITRAEQLPFFARHYFNGAENDWRRIDATWLEPAETMALQLDAATNNTSLVLAVEIVATGEVLLFPGDAQAGSWMSWQSLAWEHQGRSVTAKDLLARTVFYKVGHHGSHNATLKDLGLELMTSDALTAMIPVDHAVAVKKRWTKMPLPDLVGRLKDKANGRVLRADDNTAKPADLAALRPDNVSPGQWKAFTSRVDVTDLYYELRF
jgi:beta-lactamase superfamily II metal-dependent hydrolase